VSLLEIRNLRTHFRTPQGRARAVDGVDLTVGQGEAVGLVGESGSGKSVLALSILGLVSRETASVLPGSSIRLNGEELIGAGEPRLREVRGGEIAMVFQEPMTSLNPVFPIGDQVLESVRLHRSMGQADAKREVVRLLGEVGLPDPEASMEVYPHELSGGMRQRVMIAMALAGAPRLLIADEPTTALDVTVQTQILRLLLRLRAETGAGLLLISHDLEVVSRACDRVVILYGGRVMEMGPTKDVLRRPGHPYTRVLLDSRLSIVGRQDRLTPIPGEVPEATSWPAGCRFHPRCPQAFQKCRVQEPELILLSGASLSEAEGDEGTPEVSGDRASRCWLLEMEGPP